MQESVQQNNEQNQVDQQKTTSKKVQKKSSEQFSTQVYQSKQGLQPPPSAPDKHKNPIQAKQKAKGPIKAKQGKKGPIQAKRGRVLQRFSKSTPAPSNGLPEPLKTNMEQHSGIDLSGVKVHRNSSQPARLDQQVNSNPEVVQQHKTEAFAQGENIHLAPGKDQHLAHEAWHVVQQKQGRVKPTQSNGINDDPKLEKEADDMGAKLSRSAPAQSLPLQRKCTTCESKPATQRKSTLLPMSALGAPIQRKCTACEAKAPQRPIQRKAIPVLSSGLPLQMKCTHCEAKAAGQSNKKEKKHPTTQMKASPIQRQCPDCDGEEKLNGLTSGGGPKTKTGASDGGKHKNEEGKSDKGNSKEPKDSGNSEGTFQVQQNGSPLVGGDEVLAKETDPLAEQLEQNKGKGTKEAKTKEPDSKKDQNEKGPGEKDPDKKTKEEPGQEKKSSPEGGGLIEQAQGQLSAAASQATGLQSTSISFKLPENTQLSEEEKQKMREQQFQNGFEASNVLSNAASQVAQLTGIGGQIIQHIQATKANTIIRVQNAANVQKAAIQKQSQASIAQAVAKAAAARSQVMAQHLASVAAIQVKHQNAATNLEADYQKALNILEKAKNNQMANLDTVYAKGAKDFRATGKKAGAQAITEGKDRMTTYHQKMKYHSDGTEKKDSLAEGYLTNRQVKARKKAAKIASESYRDSLIESANEQATKLMGGKGEDRKKVIDAVKSAQEQLKAHYDQTLKALNGQKEQALTQAKTTHTQLLTGIDQKLQMVKANFTQQLRAQLQGIDQGVQQQVAHLQQQSEHATSRLLSLLAQVASELVVQLQEFRDFLNGAPLPNPAALQNLLALINSDLGSKIAETKDTFLGRTQETMDALAESGQAAGASLQKIGANAQKSMATTLEGYLKGTTMMAQEGVKSLQQLSSGHGKMTDQLQESGRKGFEQLNAQVQENFNLMKTQLETAFADAIPKLEAGLLKALGEKSNENTNEKEMHGLISKKAEEAASKEQPAWKSIVKWVLIIVVVIAVALIAGPFVIGALGTFAGMGATSAAIVGGAIVGAATSATIQVINNWAAGDSLFKDLGKAALTGAIGGAAGAAVGVGLNGFKALAAEGFKAAAIKFAIESFVDIIVDITLKVSFGDIKLENLGKLDTWKQIGMDALISTAFSLGTNVLTSSKLGQRVTGRFQQKGADFGTDLRVKLDGTPKIEAPKIAMPPTEVTKTETGTTGKVESTAKTETGKTEASGTKVEETKVENAAKTETSSTKVEETTVESTAKTETSSTKVEEPEVKTKTEAESKTKDGKVPEGNVKGVQKEIKLSDKHEIKYTKNGKAYLCSPYCLEVSEFTNKYKSEIESDQQIRDRLNEIGEMKGDAQLKALNELEHDIYKDKARNAGLTEDLALISLDKYFREYPQNVKQDNINTKKTPKEQVEKLFDDALVADVKLKDFTTQIANLTGGKAGFRPPRKTGPKKYRGLKKRSRVNEKAKEYIKDGGEGVPDVMDVAGSKILYDTLDGLYKGLDAIYKQAAGQKIEIVKFKDKIINPYDVGYGDIKLSLKMPNGHVVELKLGMKTVDKISDREHGLYEKKRIGEKLSDAEEIEFDGFKQEYKYAWDDIFKQNGLQSTLVLVLDRDIIKSLTSKELHTLSLLPGAEQAQLRSYSKQQVSDFVKAKDLEIEHNTYLKKGADKGLTEDQAKLSFDKSKLDYPKNVKQENIKTAKSQEKQKDRLFEDALVADATLKEFTTKMAKLSNGEEGFRPPRKTGIKKYRGLKKRSRVTEKAEEYIENGGAGVPDVMDVAGSKILYDTLTDLYKGLDIIFKQAAGSKIEIVKFKDKIINPYDVGYGDIKLSLKMPNGHIVELKLGMKTVDAISNREHDLYEKKRVGKKLTDEQEIELAGFKQEYQKAWNEISAQNVLKQNVLKQLTKTETDVINSLDASVLQRLSGFKYAELSQLLKVVAKDVAAFSKTPGLADAWQTLKGYPGQSNPGILHLFTDANIRGTFNWVHKERPKLITDYPNLSIEEITVLSYYSTSAGYQINFYLRNLPLHRINTLSSAQMAVYAKTLDSAISKLSAYTSKNVLLRLEGKTQAEIDALIKSGVQKFSGYISTAKSSNSSFIDGKKDMTDAYDNPLQTVIFEVQNSNGVKVVDLEPFSQLDHELEALVVRNKKLEVVEVKYKQFPIPTPEHIKASGTEYNPENFLFDWVTNTQSTVDGKMVNPHAISEDNYLDPNFSQSKKSQAEKVLTFIVKIVD